MKIDKLLHFLASYTITLTLCLFIGYYGVLFTVLVALGKEVYDFFKYGRKLGWAKFRGLLIEDLVANALGIIGGILIWWTLL